MVDEQEGCDWMNVSSGTGSRRQTETKGHKTVVSACVCVRMCVCSYNNQLTNLIKSVKIVVAYVGCTLLEAMHMCYCC